MPFDRTLCILIGFPALPAALAACLAFLVPEFTTFGTWFAPPLLLAGLYVQTRWIEGQPLLKWPDRKAPARS